MKHSVSWLIKPLFLMAALLLWACDDSGSGSGTSSSGASSSEEDDSAGSLLTVLGQAEANGEVSPSSKEVVLDETVEFTVTPDDGFVIESVEGCGGTLEGITYTTGAITENCVVTASFSALAEGPTTMVIGQRYRVSEGDEVVTLSANSAQIEIIQALEDNQRYVALVAGEAAIEWGGDTEDYVSGESESGKLSGRYEVTSGGSVIRDTETGLEWQRCSVGQSWTGGTCLGTASLFSWEEAIELTAPGDFRIPTIEELRTLVYCSNTDNFDSNGDNEGCGGGSEVPTILLEAFPNTSTGDVWSGTAVDTVSAWSASFGGGSVGGDDPSTANRVRLVR